jgi:O-succinylbenzoic acid--CoA ligase
MNALAIPHPLQSFALARPEHPALRMGERALTARELRDLVAWRATSLQRALRVGPGSAVGLLGEPSVEWIADFFALGWLGASAALFPAAAPELGGLIEAVAPDAFVLHPGAELEPPDRPCIDAQDVGGDGAPAAPERFWPLDEVRLVMTTSGTTGAPRPVRLTTAQVIFGALGSAIRLGHALDDRWLLCLPLHRVGGVSVLLRGAVLGITVLSLPRFDAARVAQALDSGEATLVSLVPAMLERVLNARPARPFPRSLRAILLGGDAASPALLERCRELGAPVALTWGMTETASQVATRLPGDLAAASAPPLPFARVREVAGALAVEGPVAPGGLFQTRDRGFVDACGAVHVQGRADEVLISGGEKIAPEEVEAALAAHPGIAEVLVAGVADPRWGKRPVALVVARDPASPPAPSELEAFCRSRLSAFKAPIAFGFVPALPRNEGGKLSRREGERIAYEICSRSPP